MKAFQIDVDGKRLDYRLGAVVNLNELRQFLEKKYSVIQLSQAGRHVIGILHKNGEEFFFKLATTKGISALTKTEHEWNMQFNARNPRNTSQYWVPQNRDDGIYRDELYYLITDKLNGKLLAAGPEKTDTIGIRNKLTQIIEFSELIQQLPIHVSEDQQANAQDFFWKKTQAWYEAIPEEVRKNNNVEELLQIVKQTYQGLQQKPRHGDFTPWHLFALENGKLGLIDGEHAIPHGVEYYDIAYFVQRVFCILEQPEFAKEIVTKLERRKYDSMKLRTVLAARAIGGYLDESLKQKPNYQIHDDFQKYVSALGK